MTETAVHTKHKPYGPYERYFKRLLDFVLALMALVVLSPVFLILTIVGAIAMKGNPFFVQKRPGKISRATGKEKIFSLIKFRTMSNAKDSYGNFLPDEERINKYGRFLRSTSLDELPEIINILIGDMSVVGPRPLLVKYLPYYTAEEHGRHSVRPGLTGLAQVNGRSFILWNEIFAEDLRYVEKITLAGDVRIVLKTVLMVLMRKNIADVSTIEKHADGYSYVKVNGKMQRIHRSLCEEREEMHVQ